MKTVCLLWLDAWMIPSKRVLLATADGQYPTALAIGDVSVLEDRFHFVLPDQFIQNILRLAHDLVFFVVQFVRFSLASRGCRLPGS